MWSAMSSNGNQRVAFDAFLDFMTTEKSDAEASSEQATVRSFQVLASGKVRFSFLPVATSMIRFVHALSIVFLGVHQW